ncbi:hypothetical protein [Caballeronia sordidicola]|uniref:Uncharacterized protein n=1 Tax=Caballeronia sordidicola TaxID=196367 RepID=A0A226WLW1_CABSO|nr:hypothetical protein [Caballeronia sordidicola]OXC72176.1 hypothetical protein BSU04_43310 [Caballeronia sordidicola]
MFSTGGVSKSSATVSDLNVDVEESSNIADGQDCVVIYGYL